MLCSHLHVDHVGWNTRLENGRWVPTFPNARYLIGATRVGALEAGRPGGARAHRRLITDSVMPVFDTGQADLIGDGTRLTATSRSSPRRVTRPAFPCCG